MRYAAIGLPPFRGFSLEEIEEATNNFDPTNLIGEGSQGQVRKSFAWIVVLHLKGQNKIDFRVKLLTIMILSHFFRHWHCSCIKASSQMVQESR